MDVPPRPDELKQTMSRSGLGKQLLAWGTFGGVMLGGWALMTLTVPTKEEMLKVKRITKKEYCQLELTVLNDAHCFVVTVTDHA